VNKKKILGVTSARFAFM